MTRTTPLRRMILQFLQIFFTDARTFMSVFLRAPALCVALGLPPLPGPPCLPSPQPRICPERPTLPKFAFLRRLSYWDDIMCAWSWAMKSIVTTTRIISDVPPK